MLEEQLDEFMCNRKHDDCICMMYQDLICTAGLSPGSVQHAIEVLLKELAGIKVRQLPKTTFANQMLLEARMLDQTQVTDDLKEQISLMKKIHCTLMEHQEKVIQISPVT